MLRLAKWLAGTVAFSFCGGFCEGFLNACIRRRLAISAVRVADGTLFAECPAVLYPLLRPAARENGGRLRVLRRTGLPFVLRPLKNRWGLLAGLVMCMALVGFLEGFIWQVEVTGCETLKPAAVQQFLAKNGFHEGVHRRAADENRYESLLMAAFDECAWAHINYEGTTAVVEIGEASPKPAMEEDTAPADVVAQKSGAVVKVTVHSGWQQVEEGEGVVRGDTLIAGSYDSEPAERTLYTHASGEVLALVEEPFSLTVSRTQEYKTTRAAKTCRRLLFFGLAIPLYGGKMPSQNADTTEEYRYLRLNGNRLPIGVRTITAVPYDTEEYTLTDDALEELVTAAAEEKIAAVFGDGEVLERHLTTVLNAESATVSGTLLCRENIAEERKLKTEE